MTDLTLTPVSLGALSLAAVTPGSAALNGPSEIGDIPVWDGSGYDFLNYWFDVRSYGAVGDGVADDTTAIQAAHDAAVATRGTLYLPIGTFKCALLYNPNVSIRGQTADGSVLLGKPSTDVIRIDPALVEVYGSRTSWRDFTIRVDDSVDASASFPQRGGVGNSGLAVDYANGASAYPRRLANWDVENVKVESISGTVGGQNASGGFYLQAGANISRFRNLFFYRLKYGWWDHYPTSNLTSVEFFNDHNHWDSIYANNCGNAIRFINHANSSITNLIIHGAAGQTGFQGLGATSANRGNCYNLVFNGVFIESVGTPWALTGEAHVINTIALTGSASTIPIQSSYSTYNALWVAVTTGNLISVSGSYNNIVRLLDAASPTTPATFTDTGGFNSIQLLSDYHLGVGELLLSSGNVSVKSATGILYLETDTAGFSVYLRTAGNTFALEADSAGGLRHGAGNLGFFNKAPVAQPAANADTSGATLVALETEVNELKAALRSLGLIAT